jgi:PST family polysaccharide transporter
MIGDGEGGRGWRQGGIVHNALALYAIQGAGYLLPLVTLPYLARVLRPEGWGLVVFAQSYAVWLSILLHYGFAFSATRAVAQHRHEPDELAEIVGGVLSAKLLLFSAVVLIGCFSRLFNPLFRQNPAHLLCARLAAVIQGFAPLWFFQGVERLRKPAAVDVAAKALGTAGVFLLIRSPAHGWGVLALRAASELATTGVLTVWMYRSVPFRRSNLRAAASTLKKGWPLFVFSSAASLYTSANAFVLGLMAPPREVSFFGAGEKVVRAASTLLSPLSQAIYPRVSHLMAHDREHGARLIRKSLLPFLGMGLLLGGGLFLAAPLLTRVAFGPEYGPTVTVIRILAFVPPLLGIGTVLGLHWALPLGMDRIYMRFVLIAGALNLVVAVVLVPRFASAGMAIAAVLAEASVEIGLIWLALRPGERFWRSPAATTEPPQP